MNSPGLTRRELITGAAALAAYAMLPDVAYAADALPPDRLVFGGSWEGMVGVAGGIPNRTAQSGSVIGPYTGAPTTINNAIQSCPAGQFVSLGAGTFNVSSDIMMKSNVTLRGAVNANGAPATIINFTSAASVFFGSSSWDVSNSGQFTTYNVAGGATRGSTTVTLASAPSGLQVGQIAFISCPPNAAISGGGWSEWFTTRPFTQCVKITSKSGNDVSFTPAINADYLSGAVQLHHRTPSDTTVLAGLENLVLERGTASSPGSLSNDSHYVRFFGTDQCWMKNVKTYFTSGGGTHHVYIYASYRTEIRHCDMSHVLGSGGASSNAYCILPVHSSNVLMEDNYFHDVPNVMPMMGLNGSAFAYNYVNDLPYPASLDWLSQIVFFHGSHSHYNLFEGNWCASHYNDATATGETAHSRNNVFFRERMRGWDPTGPKRSNTQCMSCEVHHDNVVVGGCVMGEDGYHTAYDGAAPDGGGPGNSIWSLDATSKSSLRRIANYNTVNDAINSGEALTSGQTIVTSYLHSAKPAWFGNLPWPWCDPTNFAQSNNSRNLPAGYRAATGTDPTPGSGTVPSAPSNLRIIP